MNTRQNLEGHSSAKSIEISILVVDDDPTCLNVVTKHLQKMNYHVIGMTNPMDALYTLRRNYKKFDIVLSDVHMPQMSGLDLLSHVQEEFQLPFVLMSADCDKNIMLQGLENGASFYIVKPITQECLKKLWQFAISGKKPSKIDNKSSNITSISPSNNSGKLTLKRAYEDTNEGVKNNNNKKPKLIWTTSLHNQFLEAVNKIGIEKAVPKKILEHMNVPGLRRENVASHLQKYRIFLKRISELSNSSENGILNNSNERPLRSSFILNEITYLTNNLQQQYKELLTERGKGQRKLQGNSSGDTNPKYKKIIDTISDDILIYPSKGTNNQNNNNNNNNNNATRVNCNKNIQSNNNYVGLRISTNGELVGTLNHATNKGNTLFGTTQEITSYHDKDDDLRQLDISIHFDNNQGTTFGNDFGFESFDLHDYGLESFDGFDKGIFINDDISFDKYYNQDFGQQNFGDFNQEDNFTKAN